MRLLVGYTNQMPQVAEKRSLPGREKAGDDILAFGAGYAHLNVTPNIEWTDVLAQCPTGWTPEVYIHWSPEYNPIPAGLEDADCLTVGVFGDWNLGGQAMRTVGGLFDALVADRVGCERLRDMGFTNVLHSLLWAHEPDKHRVLHNASLRSHTPKNAILPEYPTPNTQHPIPNTQYPTPEHRTPEYLHTDFIERDIDILMIGNFNHAIQWERARWLARVAALSTRYKVVLTSGVYGDEYVRLMNRAKIVFNRSIRGEANMRAYEAPACGALMFYEAENREVRDVYADREHCVLYDDSNLEALLAHYLAPENRFEREQIARNGRERVTKHSYAHHFADLLNRLEPFVAAHQAGSLPPRAFCRLPAAQQSLQLATHWLLTCNAAVYSKAEEEKKRRKEEKKTEDRRQKTEEAHSSIENRKSKIGNLQSVLAGEMARCAVSPQYGRQKLQAAIGLARQLVHTEPEYTLARLNLAYLYFAGGRTEEGENTLREVQEQLQAASGNDEARKARSSYDPINYQLSTINYLATWQMQGVVFPRCFQWFDVALERIYGECAPGNATWRSEMQALLTCRVHLTLAEITFARGQFADSARHAEIAAAEMPALGEAHYALACALRALGRVEEALAAYRSTLLAAPFHAQAREESARLYLDVERANDALTGLNEWLAVLNGCPVYAHLIPATQALRRQAQALQRQQGDVTSPRQATAQAEEGPQAEEAPQQQAGVSSPVAIKRLLALPDWNRAEEWQALVRAFALAYAPTDPVLLMLRADPATHPNAQALLREMEQFLRQTLAITADRLPNITLLHQPLPQTDCWKLLHVADALIADQLPLFWRELAQARCLPILTIEQMAGSRG